MFVGFGLKLALSDNPGILFEETSMPITPQERLVAAHHRAPRNLPRRDAWVVRMIMSGELAGDDGRPHHRPRVKKETIGEITAAAQVMREFSTKVHVADKTHLVDIRGHRRRRLAHFNISTCSMFVSRAAGAKISKHGGRSVSSKSGSADVLRRWA